MPLGLCGKPPVAGNLHANPRLWSAGVNQMLTHAKHGFCMEKSVQASRAAVHDIFPRSAAFCRKHMPSAAGQELFFWALMNQDAT
jgi:hypothetical protein